MEELLELPPLPLLLLVNGIRGDEDALEGPDSSTAGCPGVCCRGTCRRMGGFSNEEAPFRRDWGILGRSGAGALADSCVREGGREGGGMGVGEALLLCPSSTPLAPPAPPNRW